MSIILFILILCFLGWVAYLVQYKAKFAPFFKWLILGVIIVLAVMLILTQFGIWDELKSVRVPKI